MIVIQGRHGEMTGSGYSLSEPMEEQAAVYRLEQEAYRLGHSLRRPGSHNTKPPTCLAQVVGWESLEQKEKAVFGAGPGGGLRSQPSLR